MLFSHWAPPLRDLLADHGHVLGQIEGFFPKNMDVDQAVTDFRQHPSGVRRTIWTLLSHSYLFRIVALLGDVDGKGTTATVECYPRKYLMSVDCEAWSGYSSKPDYPNVRFTVNFVPESGIAPLLLIPDYEDGLSEEAIAGYSRLVREITNRLYQ